jgi:hypothetical protein
MSPLEDYCDNQKWRRAKAVDAIMRAGPPPSFRSDPELQKRIAAERESEAESYALCPYLVAGLAVKQQQNGVFPELPAEKLEEVSQSVKWLRPGRFNAIDKLVLDSMRSMGATI